MMNAEIIKYKKKKLPLIIVVAGIILFLILSCIIGYRLFNGPRYLVLSILPPDPYSSNFIGKWNSIEFIKQIESDSNNIFYIWRAEEIVVDNMKGKQGDLDSWDSITTYFDENLNKHGWVPYKSSLFLCPSIVPECQFLSEGENGYRVYARQDQDKSLRYFPIACLAVWPEYYQDGRLFGYHVVLATQNPSIKTYLNYLFD